MSGEAGASYCVVLFYSVSGALMAEKILKKAEVSYKVIPVPRHISSDCGVCVRILSEDRQRVEELITGSVEYESICPL